jgi:hypothetical protein
MVGRRYPKYHPSLVTYMKSHMDQYTTVELSPRLYQAIQFLGDITTSQQVETGGFLIKTGIGTGGTTGVRVVNYVKGEGREIMLEPQEQLEIGEEYLGTIHCHPLTPVPSVHDVLTYVSDPSEKMMIVRGVEGSINLLIKDDATRPLDPNMVEQIKDRYPKGDMTTLVRDYDFAYYQGKTQALQRVFEIQPLPRGQAIQLDDLVLGIQGSNAFPDASKKTPSTKKGENQK